MPITLNYRAQKLRREGKAPLEPRGLTLPTTSTAARKAAQRVEAYIRSTPLGVDLSATLDTPERREREAWLRGVLDCCED